jgi:maltose O-acetyltransferase
MIRRAEKNEAQLLTDLSFRSKAYWGYPESYFQIWKDELTLTAAYIEKNDVFVFETEERIAGYYSMVKLDADLEISGIRLEKGFWLEHMFVLPDHIGRKIGSHLFKDLADRCEEKGIAQLKILADPNARVFYEKMGCRYHRDVPSTIKGRTTPLLSFCREVWPV